MKLNKKGISLIVLVITIVVMIILASAIILSISSGDIRGKANEAVSSSDMSTAREIVAVAQSEWNVNQDELEEDYENFAEYANKKLEKSKVENVFVTEEGAINVKYVDENGDVAIIPEGFVASSVAGENIIEDGLVIYKGKDPVTDDNVKVAQETRDQFVWVPVDVPEGKTFEQVFARTTTYTGTITAPSDSYTEPYKTSTYTEEEKEYLEMRESVNKYNGFYIGRYEVGTNATRTSSSDVTDVFVQKNKEVYNHVVWGTSMTEIGTKGAVYLARRLCNTRAVRSTLCYGVQWDAAIIFLSKKDSTYATESKDKGNNTGTILKTGSNYDYALNNIYDMAGNVSEWTMEASSSMRVPRGVYGSYVNGSVNYTLDVRTTPLNMEHLSSAIGFRVALYIK